MSSLPDFDKLWNYSDPAGTELKFRAILDEQDTRSDRPYHLQLLTQIARTYSLRHMFAEAHAILDEVKDALPEQKGPAHVRYHLERGRAYRSSGENENARCEFDLALADCDQANDDFHTVDTLHMLAIVAEPDEAINWNSSAMQKAESSANERARNWLGSLYNNLGWAYFDKGDLEHAMAIFRKGLAWQQSKNRTAETVIAKWAIARTCRAMGRLDEALMLQREMEKEHDKSEGYNQEEIGECLLAMGRNDESKPYFAKAYELLKEDQYLQSHEAARLKRLLELSH